MKSVKVAPEGPRRYEGMFLVESGLASREWDAVEGRLKEMVERGGGKILSAGKWDERKLAYELGSARRGTYWLCYFEGPPDAPGKIRRTAGLSETVLRCLILAMDVAEEVPQDVTSKRSTVALGDDREPR
ncbi:MAG: 30S ribosomal protein S6 [Planctomycetes bacterium]|nr:30S ribosomal protein S6 [Planctomycetota bacterium]